MHSHSAHGALGARHGSADPFQQAQWRGYAKKGGSKKGRKPSEAAAAPKPRERDIYAPAHFKGRAFNRGTPHARLQPRAGHMEGISEAQYAVLSSMVPDNKPLRSLRQIGWDLGPEHSLALLHHAISEGCSSQDAKFEVVMAPIMLNSQHIWQTAAGLAEFVKMALEDSNSFASLERWFTSELAQQVPPYLAGIKLQVKGRLTSKGGKASKRVFVWGRTSVASFDDPVDYAERGANTRLGMLGVKVWLCFKKEHISPNWFTSRGKSAASLEDLLARPRPTPVRASSSAWWANPQLWPEPSSLHQLPGAIVQRGASSHAAMAEGWLGSRESADLEGLSSEVDSDDEAAFMQASNTEGEPDPEDAAFFGQQLQQRSGSHRQAA